MSATDSARVTILVAVSPAEAFEIFTSDVDAWWRRGPAFRVNGSRKSTLRFEGGPGGMTFVYGKVLAWDPPGHLRFEFRGRNFAPRELTWVDVRFEPDAGGTRVTLENGGFDALPADHPVRHGADAAGFVADMGRWWLQLALALRAAATKAGRRPR